MGAGSAIAGRVCWCLVLGYLDSNSVKHLVCTEYSRTEDRVLEPIWAPRCLLRYSVPVYLYLLHSRQIPAYYLVLVCRGCHSATSGCRRTSLAHRRGRQRQQGRQGIYMYYLEAHNECGTGAPVPLVWCGAVREADAAQMRAQMQSQAQCLDRRQAGLPDSRT